jgi:hypothetical protein
MWFGYCELAVLFRYSFYGVNLYGLWYWCTERCRTVEFGFSLLVKDIFDRIIDFILSCLYCKVLFGE